MWAGAGVAAYVGSKMYSGEEITALGLVSSAVGGGVGGAAAHVGRIGWASPITSSFLDFTIYEVVDKVVANGYF
ncbi:hypothetical protein [Actinobacillus pleuropneumoniae]|uniref:hypothetical protein n=1 Tax=Actinobacillus pleuropneumoniae TaxID=715 RepID=UPI003D020BF8